MKQTQDTQEKREEIKKLLLPTQDNFKQDIQISLNYNQRELRHKQETTIREKARAKEEYKKTIARINEELQEQKTRLKQGKEEIKNPDAYNNYIQELRTRYKEEYKIIENEDSIKIK